MTLANNLATAYTGYRNNLYAMEYYRKNILPDLVRYYRGIHAHRQIDPSSAFGDLVAAEQMLSSSVSSYITILGNLWTSAVGVADFLQTDDLYQVAKRRELPELPDFNQLRHWACDHVALAASATQSSRSGDKTAKVPDDASNAQPAGGNEAHRDAARRRIPLRDEPVQTASWAQPQPGPSGPTGTPATQVLRIPPRLPGSEAPEIHISTQRTAAEIEPHISGAPSPAGRAEGAARAGRKALHACRSPAPGRGQQPDAPPGGLGRRSRQGQPDPGQDLPQPDNRLHADPLEQ